MGIGRSPFHYRAPQSMGLQFGQFYLEEHEQQELCKLGVMGDINAYFFGEDGKQLDASIHDRVIGMSLDDLRKVPLVIAVAGGAGKVEAIQAALCGGVLDVLITDSETSSLILKD